MNLLQDIVFSFDLVVTGSAILRVTSAQRKAEMDTTDECTGRMYRAWASAIWGERIRTTKPQTMAVEVTRAACPCVAPAEPFARTET